MRMFSPAVYLDEAKQNEGAFRAILIQVSRLKEEDIKDLTVPEIYTRYTVEPPRPSWRILGFKKVGDNLYEFSRGTDMMHLAGGGRSDIYSVVDGVVTHVENTGMWRS